MKSQTHSRFGPAAVKSRSTRSAALAQRRLVADCGGGAPTSDHAGHALLTHQARHPVTTDDHAAATKLMPGALGAVDGPVPLAGAINLADEAGILHLTL